MKAVHVGLHRRTRQSAGRFEGGAILLVVFGHSIGNWPLIQLIFSVHMPLFIFLSGMVARIQYLRSGVRLPRRAWALLVPYFTWLCIYVVALSPGLAQKLALAALNPRAGGLWYLYVLFGLWVVLWLLDRLPKPIDRWIAIAVVVVVLLPHPGTIEPYSAQQLGALATGSLSAVSTGPGVLGWRNVLWLFPFFGAGFLCSVEAMRQAVSRPWVWLVAGIAWVALIVVAWPPMAIPGGVPEVSGFGATGMAEYFYVPYRYALAASGITATLGILGYMRGRLGAGFSYLGRRTLAIYVLHGLFLAWPPMLWRWLPRLAWGPMQWLTASIFAIVMSLLIAVAIERNPVANSLLLGARWEWLSTRATCGYSVAAVSGTWVLVLLQGQEGRLPQLTIAILVLAIALWPMLWQRLAPQSEPV